MNVGESCAQGYLEESRLHCEDRKLQESKIFIEITEIGLKSRS